METVGLYRNPVLKVSDASIDVALSKKRTHGLLLQDVTLFADQSTEGRSCPATILQ